jgi:high-affinity nickel-transport protein
MTVMVALVFVLGLKHGFDPDHLVAIDGMTRSTRSRWCGLFFSLGHGLVVTLVGIAVAVAATEWQVPAWLEQTGALVSIGVLLTLGIVNLLAVLRTPARRGEPSGADRRCWRGLCAFVR